MASCEIVWVRCNEPAGPLLRLTNRTGQRLSIVDKCDDAHTSGSGMSVRGPNPNPDPNPNQLGLRTLMPEPDV